MVSDGFSSYLLDTYQDPRLELNGQIQFEPQINSALADSFMDIEIGKRITAARSMVNLDGDFFVMRFEVQIRGRLIFCFLRAEAAASGAYCKLNDTTYAVLNADVCRLAF